MISAILIIKRGTLFRAVVLAVLEREKMAGGSGEIWDIYSNTRYLLDLRYLLERILHVVITSGIVSLKYHDLTLYAMVNTHLGIKDHTCTSGPT